jgi:hypothetical protein
METRKVHKRRSYRILTFLAAFQPGGAHHQGPQQAHEDPGAADEHFYNKYSKNYGVGGLQLQSCVMRRGHSCQRQTRGCRTESTRTSRRCGTRRPGLTAHLSTAFWTILCVAFLTAKSHNKIQNLIQKLRALMVSLDRDTVAKACLKFRSWIEAAIASDSHFIEYLDSQYVPLCREGYFLLPYNE